jgi:hypothetical protein
LGAATISKALILWTIETSEVMATSPAGTTLIGNFGNAWSGSTEGNSNDGLVSGHRRVIIINTNNNK